MDVSLTQLTDTGINFAGYLLAGIAVLVAVKRPSRVKKDVVPEVKGHSKTSGGGTVQFVRLQDPSDSGSAIPSNSGAKINLAGQSTRETINISKPVK